MLIAILTTEQYFHIFFLNLRHQRYKNIIRELTYYDWKGEGTLNVKINDNDSII